MSLINILAAVRWTASRVYKATISMHNTQILYLDMNMNTRTLYLEPNMDDNLRDILDRGYEFQQQLLEHLIFTVPPARATGNSDDSSTTSGYGETLAPFYYTVPRSQGTMSAQMDSTFPPVSASPFTSTNTRLAEPRLKRPRYRRILVCSECRRNKVRCCHQSSTRASQDSDSRSSYATSRGSNSIRCINSASKQPNIVPTEAGILGCVTQSQCTPWNRLVAFNPWLPSRPGDKIECGPIEPQSSQPFGS